MNQASLKEQLASQRSAVKGKSFAAAIDEYKRIESIKVLMRLEGLHVPPAIAPVNHRRRTQKNRSMGC